MEIGQVKAAMGHRGALMGNGTPAEVEAWARACLDKAAPGGGMILSFGGGLSPGTRPENVDALLEAARAWPGAEG